ERSLRLAIGALSARVGPLARPRRPRLEAESLPDQVERTPLRLAVDAADVLSDDAKREELYAADEEDADEDRHPRGHPGAREDSQAERVDDPDGGEERGHEAHRGHDAKRDHGERRYPIEGEAQHLRERVLALAGVARHSVIGNADL